MTMGFFPGKFNHMKIWELLTPECIHLNLELASKDAVLRFSAEVFTRNGTVLNAHDLYQSMKKREEMMSTGIGNGVGIPHAPSREAHGAAVILLRLAQPIDFGAMDMEPVDIVIGLVVPENATALHLRLLAGISRLCHNPLFMDTVRQAEDMAMLRDGLRDMEEASITS